MSEFIKKNMPLVVVLGATALIALVLIFMVVMQYQTINEKMLSIANYPEKCKSKPQRDITSHLSEWLSSKRIQITNVGKDVEKGNPSTLLMGV